MKKIGIGVMGCGVIGSAVVNNLVKGAADISARLGAELEVRRIAELNPERKESVPESVRGLFTDNLDDILNADDIDIVIELMGGIDIAFKSVMAALENKKHVVTANKHLLAKRGEQIYQAAEENGVEIGFEASVAGAIPIIRTLREGIAGGSIISVNGIINGTANYILTKMSETDEHFEDVLREAQELGYAEADPTFDIEGIDAAHKIAIIASLAFGTPVEFDQVYTEGITRLTQEDFGFARQFGKVIKLLGVASLDEGKVDVRVHPAMLDKNEPIAKIDGVTNAVELKISHADDLMLTGPGAGGDPTSSAVIADAVEIARNILTGSVGRVSPTAFRPEARKNLPIKPMEEIKSSYYLRFVVSDKPGVLAELAGALGRHGISVDSAMQKTTDTPVVPLVIFTHQATERDLRAAVNEIDASDASQERTLVVRLVDGEG